jgi:hypothetical protein
MNLILAIVAVAVPLSALAGDLTVRSRVTNHGAQATLDRMRENMARVAEMRERTSFKLFAPKKTREALAGSDEAYERAKQNLLPHEITHYMTPTREAFDIPSQLIIVDIETKTKTIADKARQTYYVQSFADMLAETRKRRTKASELDEMREGTPPPVRERLASMVCQEPVALRPSGATETIAGYEAKEYRNQSDTPSCQFSVWVAEALEEPTQGRTWDALRSLHRGLTSYEAFYAEATKLKGLPLRTTRPQNTIEVVEVTNEPVPPEVFTVPSGYTRVDPPKMPD